MKNETTADRTVYVKPIMVTDLPPDVQEQAEGAEKVFAVHNADGEQLALVGNRRLAFALAKEHDFAPVMVH